MAMILKSDAEKEVFGKTKAVRRKTEKDKNATPTRRQPRNTLKAGDVVTIIQTDVFIEEVQFSKDSKTVEVEVLLAQLKRGESSQHIKFYVSWLANTGFPVLAFADDTETCKKQFAANATKEAIEKQSNANSGNVVEKYQSAPNQTAGVAALLNNAFVVGVRGYYMDRFNTTEPKVSLTFMFCK